ncbi:MAG TPA: type II CAAX endopeptidase family protein [Gemmatimonadaceae bacterium]|nr:type II CAAX endopeptidase family protein [Gemmatimonadaceae bacterium]
MNASNVLLNTERKLRAPWRIVIFLVVLFVALILSAWLEMAVDGTASGFGLRPLVSEWSVPLGTLVATWVVLKAVDGKSWEMVGLERKAAAPRTLAYGSLLGFLPIAIPCAILLLTGELKSISQPDGSWWGASGISFANLLPAAFGEELMLRGYIFAVLREAVGTRWTLISTSVVFGLLHMANPGADAQSIAIVMMAGFFLGSIFLATRSLYAATAAHFLWNWFMAAILHAPVSGIAVTTPDYRVIDSGPDWLTGGPWGPEGGFAAVVGMFVVLIYLHARPLRRMES